MRRVHVAVRGLVQGVGYRFTMRATAEGAGATGWVRNRHDGSVEAEVEGTREQVDAVLDWAAKGPRGGRVDAVEVADVAPAGGQGFEVRPDA
ncbi:MULTISPECIES: acylphosphatase [unclassified Microbacterium]|uniref:acylphosphatase n=1 Tax=unclassified Microbacterium TaxID=2609290 RepID=UPI003862FF83